MKKKMKNLVKAHLKEDVKGSKENIREDKKLMKKISSKRKKK